MSSSSRSSNADPLESMAASTVSMLILFGSLTFATVGMMTRTLLSGDKRAILIATSVKLKSPFYESINTESQDVDTSNSDDKANVESAESVISFGDTVRTRDKSIRSNYSSRVIHARSNAAPSEGNTVASIKVRESLFVQIFVLMYHMMLFGLVLFGLYLLEKYPPSGLPSAHPNKPVAVLSEPFQFNADQFLSWMTMLVIYTCYISWQRNDGKTFVMQRQPKATESDNEPIDGDVGSKTKSESPNRKRHRSTQSSSRRDDISSISRGSTHSGFSKRMEEVMLEDVLGHEDHEEDHDTIEEAFETAKRTDKSWFERGLGLVGINLKESGVIRDCNSVDDVLNPIQTLEWKGMLSVSLLLYQFCSNGRSGTYMAKLDPSDAQNELHGSHLLVWRNLETVALSSFLFLTGYNHTSHYYFHPDNQKSPSENLPPCYGISRVIGIIFRWNWTAIFLSLVLGNNMFEYYVLCPLHSCCFLSIWFMLRTHHSINCTKYKFRFKVLLFASLVVSFDMLLAKLSRNYPAKSVFWEFLYLSHLHHLAPVIGCIFAINKPIVSLQLRKLEANTILTSAMSKGIICIALTAAAIMWAVGPLRQQTYNNAHAHFGVVTLLAYLYWRNLSHGLRSHHNHFFSWIGQYSLEIFLLCKQTMFHGNALVFVAGYPHLNFLLVCVGIIYLAKLLKRVTTVIQQFLVPEDEGNHSIAQMSTLMAGAIALFFFVKLLCWADLVNLGSISTIVIILGVLLYQVIMDMSWAEYQCRREQGPANTTDSSITKICVPVSGIMSIFFLAVTWYSWVMLTGSATALDECVDHVNSGFWIPINSCNVRGLLNEGINYFGYSECEDVGKEWTWSKAYLHCGFRFRSDDDIKSSLLHKRVTFIGDSSIRSLFYSLIRSMGDHDAGGYEGIASHSDLRRLFPAANIEYKWSPLSVDVVSKLKSMRTAGFSSSKPLPDLLVAGGGAWDKLHTAATDEDQQSHREVISKLALELDKIREQGVTVVWVTPPVINTPALNSDEKRAQMSEESLEETRQLYRDLGVEGAASFVLVGPTFTKDRTSDSFDGIDYPPDVYEAGIQVLANALDWILAPSADEPEGLRPDADIVSNPFLGAQVLIFAVIGLFFFDAYFGVSYLAALFVKEKVAPSDIYQDAMKMFSRHEVSNGRSDPLEGEEVMELLGRPSRPRSSGRSVYSSSSLSRRR